MSFMVGVLRITELGRDYCCQKVIVEVKPLAL